MLFRTSLYLFVIIGSSVYAFMMLPLVGVGWLQSFGVDVLSELVFSIYVYYILFALLAISIGDVSKVLTLRHIPLSDVSRLYLTLVNLVSLIPVMFLATYSLYHVAPPALFPVLAAYVVLLSMAMASIDSRLASLFSVAAAVVALAILPTAPLLSALSLTLALFIVAIRIALEKTREFPQVLLSERVKYAVFNIRSAAFVLLFTAILIAIAHSVGIHNMYARVSPHSISIWSVGIPNILASILVSSIATLISLAPPVFNIANRYIDAYIWYLRAIRGTPPYERVVKVLFHFAITAAGMTIVYMLVDSIESIEVEYAIYNAALATLAGTLTLAKEDDRSVVLIVLIYMTLSAALFQTASLLVDTMPPDIILTILTLATAITLYDAPLKVKKILHKMTTKPGRSTPHSAQDIIRIIQAKYY